MFNQIASGHMTKELLLTWSRFAKNTIIMAQKKKLLETRLNNITAVKNARKTHSQQSNKGFQTRDILYAKNA